MIRRDIPGVFTPVAFLLQMLAFRPSYQAISNHHSDFRLRTLYAIWTAPPAVALLAYSSLEELEAFDPVQRLLFCESSHTTHTIPKGVMLALVHDPAESALDCCYGCVPRNDLYLEHGRCNRYSGTIPECVPLTFNCCTNTVLQCTVQRGSSGVNSPPPPATHGSITSV